MLLTAVTLAALSTAAFAADIPVSGAPPLGPVAPGGTVGPNVPAFEVANGFTVTSAIDKMPESRFMEYDNFGNLYVSAPRHGTITTYQHQPDGTYKMIADVVTGRSTVHGMCFHDGWLWFTTSGGISKGKPRQDGTALDELTVVIPDDTLPHGGAHWWRSILVDDTGFYTSVGDPENLSDQTDTDREKIWRYSLDGKTRSLFVTGIRNTEKLRFRPGTTEVWGLDHGSDNFGLLLGDKPGKLQPITDRIPGEEINHYIEGKFYGHPFIVDDNLIRPEYYNKPGIQDLVAKATPPEFMFPAHFADCGWNWLTHDSAIGKRGDMIVTSHGSWNSVKKVGYCVSILHFDANGKPTKAERLVYCLAPDGVGVLGRPVDVVEEPNSDTLLFSVDVPAGRVYRLSASK
jgi:glucose/arabinose dehydrogenase